MCRHLLLSALICCVGVACARTQTITPSPIAAQSFQPAADPKVSGRESVGQKGIRAYIDPATGQMRAPTAEELAAEAAQRNVTAAAKVRAPVEEIKLPNGMTEVRIGKDAEVAEITCIQPDGSLGACSKEQADQLRAKDPKSTP